MSVWVTRVRSLPEALDSLDRMITVACGLPRPAWLGAAEAAWRRRGNERSRLRRAIIPVWRRPWMVLGREVVLPDEPYAFTETDGPDAFPGVEAALISGRHLTWYGPSLEHAPGVLSNQLRSPVRVGLSGCRRRE